MYICRDLPNLKQQTCLATSIIQVFRGIKALGKFPRACSCSVCHLFLHDSAPACSPFTPQEEILRGALVGAESGIIINPDKHNASSAFFIIDDDNLDLSVVRARCSSKISNTWLLVCVFTCLARDTYGPT